MPQPLNIPAIDDIPSLWPLLDSLPFFREFRALRKKSQNVQVIRKSLESQLRSRGPASWNDSGDALIARRKIFDLLKKHFGWPCDYFIPRTR